MGVFFLKMKYRANGGGNRAGIDGAGKFDFSRGEHFVANVIEAQAFAGFLHNKGCIYRGVVHFFWSFQGAWQTMRVQKHAAMGLLRTTWDRAGLELMRI